MSSAAPAHRLQDAARQCWAAVTIRVAWTLYRSGVRPDAPLLHEVRDHVLLSLPDQIGRLQAEELASYFAEEYLRRMKQGRYKRAPLPVAEVKLRPSWRERLLEALDPIGEVVLRLHYGDDLGLPEVERLTRVDRSVLYGAMEGVRHAQRAMMDQDGVGHARLDTLAIDALLVRVAQLPSADCQGGIQAGTLQGRVHAENCPRCARGVRLVRAGLLSPAELVAPRERPARPAEQVSVLALHLHPDARHHRRELFEALAPGAMRADDDALLVDLDRIPDHVVVLHELALQSSPSREHLRGAMLRGPGRWTRAGLIGPVASAAIEATRARPWGEVDGAGSLPEPLPEPPGSARWWSAAILATLAALFVGFLALAEPESPPAWPLAADFVAGDGVQQVRLDMDDRALLLVIADTPQGLEIVHASTTPWDKGDLGTGDGAYRVRADARRLLVGTTATPVEDLELLVAAAERDARPLEQLASRLRSLHPEADLRLQPLLEEG